MNKKYYLYAIIGLLTGLIFPLMFIFLDIWQLGEELGLKQISFVVKSQNIYLFSLISFPLVFSAIFILFARAIFSNRELKDANDIIKEERKKSAMNARLASLGVLSAGIGHEINNPLTILQGNNELIKKRLEKQDWINEDIEKRFAVSNETIKRISTIVDGLRTMARMDDAESHHVNSHKIINQVVEVVKYIYKKEGVDIIFEFDAKNPVFNGNAGKFQQVILNLISNAKDATLEVDHEGEIKIATRNNNDKLHIDVIDKGSGIAKEDFEKIYDTFFTTKKVGQGVGMGLSIAQSIIQEMDGSIDFTSEKGSGTTFTITLDSDQDVDLESIEVTDNLETDEVKKKEQVATSKEAVLVVDDEEHIRSHLEELLKDMGFNVDTACDGQEAYEKLNSSKYKVLITDLKMPRMTGEELVKKLKGEGHEDLRVIVITGGIITEYNKPEHEIIRELVDDYIKKPFSVDEIYESLSKHIKDEE